MDLSLLFNNDSDSLMNVYMYVYEKEREREMCSWKLFHVLAEWTSEWKKKINSRSFIYEHWSRDFQSYLLFPSLFLLYCFHLRFTTGWSLVSEWVWISEMLLLLCHWYFETLETVDELLQLLVQEIMIEIEWELESERRKKNKRKKRGNRRLGWRWGVEDEEDDGR